MSLNNFLDNTQITNGWQNLVKQFSFTNSAEQTIMSDGKSNEGQDGVRVSISETPEEIRKGFSRRLYDDYNEAAQQVDVDDISNDEKLGWLLDKLRLSQHEQKGLIDLLRTQASEKDPEEALKLWKVIVMITWSESAKLDRMEEDEVQEVQGQQLE